MKSYILVLLASLSLASLSFGLPLEDKLQNFKRSSSNSTLGIDLPGIVEIDLDLSPLFPPSNDTFYQPPDGYESTAPGTILKARQIDTTFLGILPQNVKESYQLLYRTVDTQLRPSHTVVTILVPYNARPGPEIVSFQNAEDSANINCAPSYQLRAGGDSSNVLIQVEILLMDHILSEGRIVITSDYEGPLSGFVNGPLAATGVLDGIRATLNFDKVVQNRTSTKIALNGYSGGALATGWALQQAAFYAPELSFIGAAMGGLPVNIEHIFNNVNAGLFAGIAAAGIAGLLKTRPELADLFHNVHNYTGILDTLEESCITDMVAKFANFNFYTLAGINMTELYGSQPLKAVFDSLILGGNETTTPPNLIIQTPMYLYHAILDEVIVPKDIDNWAEKQCAANVPSLEHVRELVGEHVSLQITGAAGAFNFLDNRFKGRPPVQGCKTRNVVTSLLDPLALVTFSTTVLEALTSLLGLPIGKYF